MTRFGRSGRRVTTSIWTGFVDAKAALLLVFMFVLTIFMIIQFVLSETIAAQESELSSRNAIVANLNEALSMNREEIASLGSQVVERDGRIAELDLQLGDRNRELDLLSARIASDELKIDALGRQVAALDETIQELNLEVAGRETDIAVLQDRIGSNELLIAELNAQVEERDGEVSELNSWIEGKDAEIAGLKEQLSENAVQIVALTGDVALRNNTISSLSARAADLESRLSGAQERTATQQQALLQARIDREGFQQDLERKSLEIEALGAKLADSVGRVEELTEELSALAEVLDMERRASDESDRTAQGLASERDSLQIALATLEAELGEEQRKVSDVELALAAMLEANEELKTEVQDAKSEVVRLGEVRDNLDMELAAALLRISEAEARAEEAESLADTNLESAARLEAEKDVLADRLAAAESARDADAVRFIAELNMQAAELNEQISALRASLDSAVAKEENAQVEIRSLGSQLNSALARAAAESARRLKAEEERNELLEEESRQLERFQSAFLSGLRDKIEGRDGVRIEGDRFVFSSEVLFESNDATLSEKGKAEIGNVADLLAEIAEDFPQEIDWILRVDGHTDVDPIRDGGIFKDNWELSQARSLSVVRYLIDEFDFEPKRLAATGFGEHRPIASGSSEEAKSRNRRIELKLTGS